MTRQAYFRDAKASYNDIVWRPRGDVSAGLRAGIRP
jgi:hypothetical protein